MQRCVTSTLCIYEYASRTLVWGGGRGALFTAARSDKITLFIHGFSTTAPVN